MYRFYVSYAHSDSGDNSLVHRFYEDLAADVAALTGERHDRPVGFLDQRSLHIGEAWAPALVKAVATASTFVALCSPSYFRNLSCGREWTLFTERMARYEQTTGRRPGALLPILWIPMHLPSVVDAIQVRDASYGAMYDQHGLRYLLRLARAGDEYVRFVSALARRIVDNSHRHRLPELGYRPDFSNVPSAFGEPAKPPLHTPNRPMMPRLNLEAPDVTSHGDGR